MIFVKYTTEYNHIVSSFDCRNTVINNFLKNGMALNKNEGITYLMLSDDEDTVIGYYNISASRLDSVQNVGEDNIYEIMGSAAKINYLAIHKDYQGKLIDIVGNKKIYFGDLLLDHCEQKILELSEKIGIIFITLCSTNEGYHLYHDRNDYEDFEDDMYMIVDENDKNCYKLYKCVDDLY